MNATSHAHLRERAIFQACLIKMALSWKCIGRQPYSEGILSRAVHGVSHSFTEVFHLLSHSIFSIWPHFYDKFLEKYICLIFLPHFTTTTSGLYHSRYGFWQVHFRHLILHMRLLCNMIIDIHCDLCIWMVFAPLQSVLNGCPPDIQHPITYCITLGLKLKIFQKR